MKISAIGDKNLLNDIEKNFKKISIYHLTFSDGVGNIIKLPFFDSYLYSYKFSKNFEDTLNNGLKVFSKIFLESDQVSEIVILGNRNIYLNRSNYAEKISKIKIHDIKFSAVHILGGTPFGENKNITIVDSYGEMHEHKGLYVNDSSLINEKLLLNPQGTVMALTQRLKLRLDME